MIEVAHSPCDFNAKHLQVKRKEHEREQRAPCEVHPDAATVTDNKPPLRSDPLRPWSSLSGRAVGCLSFLYRGNSLVAFPVWNAGDFPPRTLIWTSDLCFIKTTQTHLFPFPPRYLSAVKDNRRRRPPGRERDSVIHHQTEELRSCQSHPTWSTRCFLQLSSHQALNCNLNHLKKYFLAFIWRYWRETRQKLVCV